MMMNMMTKMMIVIESVRFVEVKAGAICAVVMENPHLVRNAVTATALLFVIGVMVQE